MTLENDIKINVNFHNLLIVFECFLKSWFDFRTQIK